MTRRRRSWRRSIVSASTTRVTRHDRRLHRDRCATIAADDGALDASRFGARRRRALVRGDDRAAQGARGARQARQSGLSQLPAASARDAPTRAQVPHRAGAASFRATSSSFSISSDQRWRSVNGTLGVQRLITDGERPIAVAPGVVETLVGGERRPARGALWRRRLAIGDAVRVVAGPFARQRLGVLQATLLGARRGRRVLARAARRDRQGRRGARNGWRRC